VQRPAEPALTFIPGEEPPDEEPSFDEMPDDLPYDPYGDRNY
jgi:hypothetical protein